MLDPYIKTTYRNDTSPPLDEINLNNSEDGIEAVTSESIALDARVTDIETSFETAFLQGQNTPLYTSGAVPLNIVDYAIANNNLIPVNALTGAISTISAGVYDFSFASCFSFTGNSSTRSLYIHVYDVTNASERFKYTIAIPRDSIEVGGSFSFPFTSPTDNDYVMQISSSAGMDVTIEAVSFGITSKHIR